MATINKKNAKMEFPLQIERQYGAPLESKEIWYSLKEAQEYAKSSPIAYAGQTIKVVDQEKSTVTAYIIKPTGDLIAVGASQHLHEAAEIKETSEKSFVSKTEKERWNNTYTKPEVDQKLTDAISGLTFKGTFNTLADLPDTETAKDGWFAIVVNEPTAKGKNVLVIFESNDKKWKQLNELLIPGVATKDVDGLMGKEMVKALEQAGIDIAGLKDGSLLPKASTVKAGIVKIGANIQVSEDGTISTHAPYQHPETHPASMITEDESHRFVSDADKNVYSDKYTKLETESKLSELETKVTNAYKAEDVAIRKEFAAADVALEGKITKKYDAVNKEITESIARVEKEYKAADSAQNDKLEKMTKTHAEDKAALEAQINSIGEKLVAATDEQIDALFKKTV